MPEAFLRRSSVTGIEIDSLTAAIAKALYPDSDIRAQPFEQSKLADGYFDLAISNVPFGDYPVHDPRWNKFKLPIHDYFFAAALEKVRPAGLVMFITSRGTMDKLDSTLREQRSTRAELLGAIRLPNDAFKRNAGTEVTTDIIMLRRLRPGEVPSGWAWKQTADHTNDLGEASAVNEYLAARPEMMLGRMRFTGRMYRDNEPTLEPDGRDLAEALAQAIDRLPQNVCKSESVKVIPSFNQIIPAPDHVKPNAYCVHDGMVCIREENALRPLTDLPTETRSRIRGLVQVRDAVRACLHSQLDGSSEEQVGAARQQLNFAYDRFISRFGPINLRTNQRVFVSDPDMPLLLSLEHPIANSMAEMFTMQRYLQPDELKKHQLHHFDSWAATFGEPVTALELSPDGAGYRLNTRFARFINVPELMQMFRQTADVQTAQMLDLPRPKLENEKPAIRNAPATTELKSFVQELAARADQLKTGRIDPRVDNMLKITSEGRKAELDLRLVQPASRDEPVGKVNLAVENILRIWQDTSERRSAQLVFCDLSPPKDRGFSVYRDVADKLEARGVPARELAFIQDSDSDSAKLALFREVRAGKVRILFGSTQKMGSGTNVQERLIALHHLDAPWRPADVEQREGRILRQGNTNATVQIFRYVTEGSFDAHMWQTLETKAKFIAQVMCGDMTIRRLEDLDSAALTYAEVKAIASGNLLVIEKAQVDAELMRLTRLRSAHAEEQYRIRANLRRSHEDAEVFTTRLDNLRQDTSGESSKIELDGQVVTNRGVAGELIVRRAEKLKNCFGDDIRIGHFAGFDLLLRPALNNAVEIIVRGRNSYSARVTDTELGTIRSLEATVQGFDERANRLEMDITDAHKRAKEFEGKVGAPFEHEECYQQLSHRQSEIEEKLDLTKNQAPSQAEAATEIQEQMSETETTRRSVRRVRSAIKV